MRENLYCDRDICGLDEIGGFYSRHVSAMTSESLNGKSKISAELAYRDSIIEALKADRDAQQKRADALAVENATMREAIEFATAPDMWIEQHDGMLDYRYSEWYVDVLNAAIETPATSAALAAIRGRTCKALIDAFCRQVDAAGLSDGDSVTIFECRETMKYAAEQAIEPLDAK